MSCCKRETALVFSETLFKSLLARAALSKKSKLPTLFDTYGYIWTSRNAQGRHRIIYLVLAGPSSMAVHVQYCAAPPPHCGANKNPII